MKLLLISLLSVFASSANAGIFDAQSLQFQYYFPDLSSPYSSSSNGTFAVGAGVEIANIADDRANLDLQSNGFTANFTDTSIWNGSAFNGFRITDINGTIDPFTSFTLGTNTALNGSPVLTFDANNLYVNWQGLGFVPGEVQFNVNVAAVPEPETYAMMLAGLGLMGFVARRRKDKQA